MLKVILLKNSLNSYFILSLIAYYLFSETDFLKKFLLLFGRRSVATEEDELQEVSTLLFMCLSV